MWAGNAVVGRLVHDLVPPMTLNLLRWAIAMLILLPLAGSVFRPSSGLWSNWKSFSMLGLLSVGLYNSLLYLALQSSSPINVTLVAASMPFWMLLVGRLFYGAKIRTRGVIGAVLSITGVLLVLSRGEWQILLSMQLVPGDLCMIAAAIAWAFYSWMLTRHKEPEHIRSNGTMFLLAQIGFGVVWSAAFTAGEWVIGDPHIYWSWELGAAVLFVAIGPAIIALRCWGAGVQNAGPTIAGFFSNLTPLFAALLSLAVLGELPHIYHLAAFVMIVGGIALSAQR